MNPFGNLDENTTEIQHLTPPYYAKRKKPDHLIACKNVFFAYLCSLPGAWTIVESSSNILHLLATGLNPANRSVCRWLLSCSLRRFCIALFNFVATFLRKEVSRFINKKSRFNFNLWFWGRSHKVMGHLSLQWLSQCYLALLYTPGHPFLFFAW
jgi:hypothetical protein